MAIERGLAMATALGNDRIIGGPAPASKTASARKTAPVKAAKLCLGAASDETQVVARAGLPTAMHLTMDDDDKDVDVARPSNVAFPWQRRLATAASSAAQRLPE